VGAGVSASLDAEEAGPSLEECLDTFWQTGPELDDFRVTIAPPPVPAALLKRLGAPSFWEEKESLEETLAPTYATITDQAMEVAFGGAPEAEGEASAEEPSPAPPKKRRARGKA
jgi:uncharacterized Zn finger protein